MGSKVIKGADPSCATETNFRVPRSRFSVAFSRRERFDSALQWIPLSGQKKPALLITASNRFFFRVQPNRLSGAPDGSRCHYMTPRIHKALPSPSKSGTWTLAVAL